MDRSRHAASGRAAARWVILGAALVVVAVTPFWAPAIAQVNQSLSPSGELFRAQYSDADALLNAFERGRAILYERLLDAAHAPTGRTDDSIYDELRSGLRQRERLVATNVTWATARADAVFDAADEFRRRVYGILADSRIADHATAIEQATDQYLRQPALALPPEPKSLERTDAHDGHGRAPAVSQKYPKVSSLVWAYQWLELALCEPLIAYDTPEDRRAGVAATLSRFREMLEQAPSGLPSEMPTAPAIAPSLAQRHPRAAAIFDNIHVLHHVVADILTDAHAETAPAVQHAIDTFLSPQHPVVSRDEWVLMSLRRGIWWQGGPAIGKMDAPERNRRIEHAGHARMPLPGMGDVPADVRESSERAQPREDQTPAGDAHRQH
jgi:hypothetical protein